MRYFNMETLSFVIPCYCSENSIKQVVDEIVSTVTNDGRYDYEIICINDGSKDNTYEKLLTLTDNYRIKVINLSKNFGQHSALMAGFNHVSGDIVVCIDDDGQNPPSEVFKMIDKLNEGYDLVSAKYKEKKHSLFRKIGTKISFAMSTHLVGMPKGIDLNSYCVCRRFVIDEVIKYQNSYPFIHGLMLRVTRNIANVYINQRERDYGQSGYTFKKLLALWMNGFTAFSEKPLRIATYTGGVSIIISFIWALILLIKYSTGALINYAFPLLAILILFMFGITMCFIGLLGEYIGRMYICINNAPQFVIKNKINFNDNTERQK